MDWHAMLPGEVVTHLQTDLEKGLSKSEAAARLDRYGLNQLQEKPPPTFLELVIRQLNNFVIILLIVAAVISAILGEYIDAGAILTIVILNAVLGVVQENRAQQALAALKKMAAPEAMVLRDGHRGSIPSRELVPGDVVFLEAGNFIPSDLRLAEAVNLRIDEAALTGESISVEKNANMFVAAQSALGDRKNSAFMGTVVNYGRGTGVVTSTGMNTQLGIIATMLQSVVEEETPLQRRLDQLGKTLGYACLVICALVFVTGWMQGGDPLELFMVAVSLAIAAVPEGLPAIVTISLALGMQEMIRRHALIRRLSSVETLGSATVICSDKTGTLTQNEMTVTRLWADGKFVDVTGIGYNPDGQFHVEGQPSSLVEYPAARTALWLGALNNDSILEEVEAEEERTAYSLVGDPTEGALLVAAYKAGASKKSLAEAYPRVQEVPFDSDRKRMITIHAVKEPRAEDLSPFVDGEKPDHYVIAMKGAPDVVLNLCEFYQPLNNGRSALMDDAARQRVLDANDALTRDALRVIGVAYRIVTELPETLDHEKLEKDLVFVGLLGMIDQARPEVIPAQQHATRAGIRTIMITGDYPNTARAIAENIGLLRPGHQVLTGADLDKMTQADLKEQVEITDVFARVSPEHKMRIVDALQANGEVVAMTGDGVNDAPAIKKADIGVSMGITGTDVAKETADMVLTDDNYASIVSAVEQGRIIYSNIRKFVYYLISCNLAEIFTIFIPTLLGKGSPLAPIQLLWLNLITDGAPALALGTEKGDPDIMEQQPRPPKEPIINKAMQAGVIVQTVAITTVTLIAFWMGRSHPEPQYAETMAFATLSFSELLRAFTARSERYPIWKIGFFTNRWMNIAVVFSMVMLLVVIYVPFLNPIFDTLPLGWEEWSKLLPLLVVPSIAAEATKLTSTWLQKRKAAKSA